MSLYENPAEQKYDMIVTYAPVPLAEIDETGAIMRLNVMGKQLLEPLFSFYQLPDTHLFPLLDHLSPEIIALIRDFEQPYGRVTFNLVRSFRLPPPADSGDRFFQYNINKMFPGCIMVGIDDLTLRYEEEKAMQQNLLDKAIAQTRFEMAADILHDIGNALTGFSSYHYRMRQVLQSNIGSGLKEAANFLNGQHEQLAAVIGGQRADALAALLQSIDQLAGENRELIRQAVDEQQHIVSHIQDILHIHRQYVRDHPSQERDPVSLKDLIQDSCAMLEAALQKKGIELSLRLPASVPPVKGDRVKLMQVMLNILKNSMEAIGDTASNKHIDITLNTTDQGPQIIIADDGAGFEPGIAARLFERGYTTKAFGTGLGLSNCRSIIESHSGSIEITSDGPALGTKTIIRFFG